MSTTGDPGGPPVRCGVSFLDLTTGILCAFGVLGALRLRDRTGLGQRVDGSLLETALGLLNFQAEGFLLAGTIPRALGSAHPSLSPYRNFRCRDEQWVFIAGANDRLWRRLAGGPRPPAQARRPPPPRHSPRRARRARPHPGPRAARARAPRACRARDRPPGR